jgi:branched-chain amino acid transport system ATP-binding protein
VWSARVLEVRGLGRWFLGVAALRDVDLDVRRGEILGIIGPNGSGKTTLFDCLTGLQRPDTGCVVLDGHDVTGHRPDAIARRGVVRVFQNVRVFARLSVRDNLLAAAQEHRPSAPAARLPGTRAFARAEGADVERGAALLRRVGLDARLEVPAGLLSYGQQKLLAIAMALMARPRLLLLDEPVAGVNPSTIELVKAWVRELNAGGLTIVLIEHNVDVVTELGGRVVVLDAGEKIAEGPPDVVRADARVLEAYLGR